MVSPVVAREKFQHAKKKKKKKKKEKKKKRKKCTGPLRTGIDLLEIRTFSEVRI